MRGIKTTKVLALAVLLTAMAGQITPALAQRFNIFQYTNEWKYMATNCLDGTGWEMPGFDDSSWPSGPGGFTGNETAAAIIAFCNTRSLPGPSTASQVPAGHAYYFRKHFNLDSVSGIGLVLSNAVDDAAVFYINGTRVADLRVTQNPALCGDFGGGAIGGGTEASFWEVITLSAAQLAGIIQVGDNVIAVSLHQVNNTSSDAVFVSSLTGEIAFPPMITDSSGLTNRSVEACRNTTLTVIATGSEPLTYQWSKDNTPIDPSINPTATNASLVLSNVTLLDGGNYTVTVQNNLGTVTSSPATMVTVVPDTTPPTVTSVSGEADLITYIVTFSEPMDPSSVGDFFAYTIVAADNSETLSLDSTIIVSNSTQIILTTSATPRNPAKSYNLIVNPGGNSTVSEACNTENFVPADTTTPIVPVFLFQQGINGYDGTHDAEVHSGTSSSTPLGMAASATVDNDDGGIANFVIRFDSIFGDGAGQVPFGANIVSATLGLYATDPGDNTQLHRMLIGWDEDTVTWDSLGNGPETNGVDALVAVDGTFISSGPTLPTYIYVDVQAAVQAWANGEPNNGWALLATGGNGFDFDTSEGGNAPQLRIVYTIQACSALSIITQPTANTMVNEGQPFTLSVAVNSPGCPATFQWTRDGMNIPGATNSVYSVANAAPGDAGTYRVNVMNPAPSSAMSDPAVVAVAADTIAPVLVSAVGTTNPSVINLAFSEPISLATGQSTANYSLVPVGGGAALMINSATVTGTNVVLNTAPRVAGTSYQLTINGVTDRAAANNVINPNPTVVNFLPQEILILDYMTTVWRYNTNCQDGINWNAAGFDDASWESGPGFFGLETTAATLSLLPAGAASIQTPLPVGNATSDPPQVTFYFRTSFDWPYGTSGAEFLLNHYIDDGAVLYVNGATSVAYNANTNPIPPNCTALFDQPPGGDASLMRTNLNGVATGQNVVAVEVHQNSLGSSDVLFGLQLIARVTQFGAQGPRLTITIEPGGTQARIQWNPVQGTLQFKNSLGDPNWTDVADGTSGNVLVNLDQMARFYTLRQ